MFLCLLVLVTFVCVSVCLPLLSVCVCGCSCSLAVCVCGCEVAESGGGYGQSELVGGPVWSTDASSNRFQVSAPACRSSEGDVSHVCVCVCERE